MAKAVWRRAKAILEELHDLGADEVRSRLGAAPGRLWRYWKNRTISAPMRSGPGWARRRARGAQYMLSRPARAELSFYRPW